MALHRRSRPCAVALVAVLAAGGAFAADPEPAAPASAAPAASAPAATPSDNPSPTAQPAAAAPTATAPATPAQLAPAAAPRAAAPVASSASSMVSGLLFLLVLVLGAAWLVKRSGGMPALRGGGAIKIVAALPLGPRERVVLIEMSGQQWLLGVSGGAVNVLHHFEQPIVAASGDDFADKLRQFLPQAVGK